MSSDMQRRVQEAFAAKAGSVSAHDLRPGTSPTSTGTSQTSTGTSPTGTERDGGLVNTYSDSVELLTALTPTEPPRRPRGVVTGLTIAAGLVLLMAATAIVVAVRANRGSPAHPTPTPTPAQSTSASSSAAQSSSAPANSSRPASSPPALHAIQARGVTLQVPTTWGLQSFDSGVGAQCVGPSSPDSARCQLMVIVSLQRADGSTGLDPDVIGAGVYLASPCGNTAAAARAIATVTAEQTTINSQEAEYREFTATCRSAKYEQWVVPTGPPVVFLRTSEDPATEAQARAAVASAVLPGPRTGTRLTDRGFVRSATSQADGVHITLDRVYSLAQGGYQNQNPATFEYIIPAGLTMTVLGSAGRTTISPQQVAAMYAGQQSNYLKDCVLTLTTAGTPSLTSGTFLEYLSR